MAANFKQIFLPLGILILGWVVIEKQSFLYQPTITQAQNVVLIPVSLPEKVTVHPKQGSTMSGVRLLEINAQTQQIKLQQGSNTESKSIASIKNLEFSGRAIIKGGKIVVRGGVSGGSKCGNSENWPLPLNHFQWRDSSKAQVNLTSMDRNKQREIRQINDAKTYIVDEIKFATPGSVTLKTTPCFAN